MSRERELLSKASLYLEAYWNDEGADPEATVYRLFMEIDRFLGEPAQESEPVAWMWQSDNYANRFSQRIFVLFVEADDMRNRYGGNLYPLYFGASPNAKRIAELESACKAHAELHEINEKRIFDLEGAIGVVNGEYALLRDCYNEVTDRIANGIRVYAEYRNDQFFTYDVDAGEATNATLILYEANK